MLRKSLGIIVLVASILAILAANARADVYPQSSFTYDGFGGHYVGSCTLVTNNGFHLSCVGSLVSGTPVSQLTDISSDSLHGVVTPSGQVIETVS